MSTQYETEVSLGQAIFGNAQLGDKRRTARLVRTFDLMRQHPGGTLPDKVASPADLRGLYRLCDCEEVTHAAVIAATRKHTLKQIAACPGPVLIVHDATELDYTTLASLVDDLGQIGKGLSRGYICQNVLAIEAETGEVLGLVDQILHHRDHVPDNETLSEHRQRKTRESLLWLRGTEHLPADAKLIDVTDQGSDTFEFIEHEFHSGRRFVVRACKVRKVYAGHEAVGSRIEDMQFTTIARLEPAIALLSVVAVTLLNLRDASRRPDTKTRRATTLLAADYVRVLSHWRYRKTRTDLTVHEFFLALARLGGHQNRKSDHQPGWLVLWRGWTKLQALLDGYDVAKQIKYGKT